MPAVVSRASAASWSAARRWVLIAPVVPPELIDADNRDRNHLCGFCHDLIFIDATIWSAACFEITVEEEERHQWDACTFIFNQRLPRVRT
jgi:hypothetical protein